MISDGELNEAINNLRRHQKRLNCWPECWMSIRRGEDPGVAFWIGRDNSSARGRTPNYMRCFVPVQVLRDILDRKVHWNNAEIGCLIEFDRTGPYLPDVHTLMSYFHLPRS